MTGSATLVLAWRNIWRHTRRSMLTVATVATGLAAVMFGQSFLRSFQGQMIEKATGVMLGHAQVQARAARDRKVPEVLIDQPGRWRALLEADPRVEAAGARIQYTGLVYGSGGSRGVLVSGVEPEREKRLSIIPQYLKEGRYLGESPRDAVLGAKLASDLDVRVGERLVLMAQAADGQMGSELFRVAGIYRTDSTAYDGQVVYVPLEAAQRLRGQPDRASQVVARLKDVRLAQEFADEKGRELPPEAALLSYRDTGAEIVGIKRFQDALLVVLLIVIFSIVGLGTLNTVSMSFYERIREFGVLRALGARRAAVFRVLLAEAACMGLLGALFGLAAGLGVIGFFGLRGLDLPLGRAMAYFMPFDDVIYTRPQWAMHLWSALGVYAVCLVAALAPAARAARLVISDALRHI